VAVKAQFVPRRLDNSAMGSTGKRSGLADCAQPGRRERECHDKSHREPDDR